VDQYVWVAQRRLYSGYKLAMEESSSARFSQASVTSLRLPSSTSYSRIMTNAQQNGYDSSTTSL